jgi:hypothetical protein
MTNNAAMPTRTCSVSHLQLCYSAARYVHRREVGKGMSAGLQEFAQHQIAVRRLVNFDRDILDFVVGSLREHVDRQKNSGRANPEQSGENLLRVLEPVRTNSSLRPRYETVFNQALVLLVSYFGSSVHALFTEAVKHAIGSKTTNSDLLKERLTFTAEELCESSFDPLEAIPQALALASDVSWQDMQSIRRTFKKYFAVEMARDECVNDIIAAQACRHAIVHAGGIANERTMKQLSNARPRSVKIDVQLRGRIQFSPEEIEHVSAQMGAYLSKLDSMTNAAIGV